MPPLTREECIGQPRRVWFGSCLDSPTFRVTVGGHGTTPIKSFNIHEAFLTQSSPYFSTLLSVPGFTESESRHVTLSSPVDSPEAFEVLIEFMHSFDHEYTTFNKNSYWGILHTKVFLMAGRLCMEKAQRLALRKLSVGMVDSYRGGGRLRWGIEDVVQIVDLTYANTGPEEEEADADEVFHEVQVGSEKEEAENGAAAAGATNGSVTAVSAWGTNGSGPVKNSKLALVPDATVVKPVKASPDIYARLRRLVAQFCASEVENFKLHSAFKATMEKYPDFTADMLDYLVKGRNVDEIRDI